MAQRKDPTEKAVGDWKSKSRGFSVENWQSDESVLLCR